MSSFERCLNLQNYRQKNLFRDEQQHQVTQGLEEEVLMFLFFLMFFLLDLGKRIFFVTNNSTKSRKGYKKKFDELGLDVQPEEIFSSSFAAAAYLEQTKFKDTGKKV